MTVFRDTTFLAAGPQVNAVVSRTDNNRELFMGLFDWLFGRQSQTGDANSHVQRGRAALTMGDFRRALAEFSHAIRHDQGFVDAYLLRGFAFSKSGDHEAAISDCTKAIELDPRKALAFGTRGDHYKAKGDLVQAIADYDRAIELDPAEESAYMGRGQARGMHGDHEGAIADFSKYVELAPGSAEALYNRGVAYYHASQHRMAVEDFTAALQLNTQPNNHLGQPRGRVLALRDRAFRNVRFEQLNAHLAIPQPDPPSTPVPQEKAAELLANVAHSLQRPKRYRSILIIQDLDCADLTPYDFVIVRWQAEFASPSCHVSQYTRLENLPIPADSEWITGDEWITVGPKRFQFLGDMGVVPCDRPCATEIEEFLGLNKYLECFKRIPQAGLRMYTVRESEWCVCELSLAPDSLLGPFPMTDLPSRLAKSLHHLFATVKQGDRPRPVDARHLLNRGDQLSIHCVPIVLESEVAPRSIAAGPHLRFTATGFSCRVRFWFESRQWLLVKARIDVDATLEGGQPVRLRIDEVFGDYDENIVVKEPERDEFLVG